MQHLHQGKEHAKYKRRQVESEDAADLSKWIGIERQNVRARRAGHQR